MTIDESVQNGCKLDERGANVRKYVPEYVNVK